MCQLLMDFFLLDPENWLRISDYLLLLFVPSPTLRHFTDDLVITAKQG